LPGFELTATFGFHILAIFDQDTPIRNLEHVLLRLNVPFESLEKGETEVGATSDVLTAYRIMAEAGALVIAAHANTNAGVAMFGFDFGGQTKIAYTQDPALSALEVTDLEATKRRSTASFFNGSKPQYPRRMHCIQGSDAHRVVGVPGNRQQLGVGERATEAYLSEVSFKALKELFLSEDFTRTRPYRRADAPFDHVDAARKEGPTIVQSFHEQITRQGGRLTAIVRDVVAFANTNGGTIYLGVGPNARTAPKGVEKPEEAIKELRNEIEHQVSPHLAVQFSTVQSRGANLVRVVVSKGDDVPYVMEGSKIFIRQEAESNLAMRDEIVALIRRGGVVSSEATPPPAESVIAEPVRAEPIRAASKPVETLPPTATGLVEHPHTGVEILESVTREGVLYHTMRDLRNGDVVRNVTHTSARRLWRYAIALKEKHTLQEETVTWTGDLGLWHKYLRVGRAQYDLVQRDLDGQLHIYYGVTEDGIHGPWKAVAGIKE
jgi:hypothetical protein